MDVSIRPVEFGFPDSGRYQGTQVVHEWHKPGVAAGFSCTFSSATCTNQTRKHLKGTEKRAPRIF